MNSLHTGNARNFGHSKKRRERGNWATDGVALDISREEDIVSVLF